MDRFLVNMAIVRINWDKKGSDILDNYIPLAHETLNHINDDVFSVDKFKEEFVKIAEFNIPTGAVLSLLKKAEKKYKLLEKQPQGFYKIIRDNVINNNLSAIRDSEQRKYNMLVSEFIDFCDKKYNVNIKIEKASTYFFEVLYDIAPTLFMNLSAAEQIHVLPSEQNKFYVAKFVSYVSKYDHNSFDSILSFVRGAMLTETFYYSQNLTDIKNKPLRRVVVYFDTQFLVRILRFSEPELCTPCIELLEMLRDMNVKMRYFRHTYDELYGIFYAALKKMNMYGRLLSNKPGDVFDYINQKSITPSDLLITMHGFEGKLNDLGIYIEEKPDLIDEYSIDEESLSVELSSHFENQSKKAREHDIDCLQSIFQMREGKNQHYLDKCKAIFITTNAKLARLSTLFFNKNYGHSNAPICMADHVFTSLVWMKAVKKAPDLPKDRLVANCYSALMPSDSLWAEYIKEVNRLKDEGSLNEHDYHVLIYSISAREELMEQHFSSDDNMFGSVENILYKAKKIHSEELGNKLEETENELATMRKNTMDQQSIINEFIKSVSLVIEYTLLFLLLGAWSVTLIYALIYTSPDSITDLKKINKESIAFIILTIFTVLNLLFGLKALSLCKFISFKITSFISNKLKNKIILHEE